MKIILVRHGNTNGSSFGNPGLSPIGETLIRGLSELLKTRNTILAIYSSTSIRAKETAKILSQELNIEVKYCPLLDAVKIPKGKDLQKIIAYLQGKQTKWQEEWLKEYKKWPIVESPEDFYQRTKKALKFILEEHKYSENEEVLVIGHEETRWAITSLIKEIPLPEAIKESVYHGSIRIFKFSKENIE